MRTPSKLVALLAPLMVLALAPAPRGDELADLVQEIRTKRDQVEVDTLLAVGDQKSREAAEQLIECYELFQTAYMRRHALRALAKLDGVPDAEQLALQKLLDVAVGSNTAALREAAVDSMAQCRNLGNAFLAMVVESAADEAIRVRAMQHHTGRARSQDHDWYRELWGRRPASQVELNEARRRMEEDEDYEPEPWPLADVRWLAFDALASELTIDEATQAIADFDIRVRTRALYLMEQLGAGAIEALAENALQSFGPPSHTGYRIAGAEIWLRLKGPRVADDLIDYAKRVDTPAALRDRIAELLAELDDEDVNDDLVKLVAKGKTPQKMFALLAVRDLPDEKDKLDKAIRKGLKDKEPEVRMRTLETIAHRGDVEAQKDLERLFDKTKDPLEQAACLDALVAIRRDDPEFVEGLLRDSRSEDDELRNASIRNLGVLGDDDHMPALVEALRHADWATRLQALRALEALRTTDAIGPIVDRMADEGGRLEYEFGETLFRLTAQLYGTNQPSWAQWWEDNERGFSLPSTLDLRRAERELENMALKEVTRTEFFGIEIRSHRVIFVIDVSGSMEERVRGRYLGEQGETRLEVAKKELMKAAEQLDKRSLFNLVTFSDRAGRWGDAIREVEAESLAELREHVEELRAGGATNLYGALQLAFEDPDVDTIVVLSDGEPTVDPTDPNRIEDEVELWNRNRGVTIHTVAVGGTLSILEQLAKNTGGEYVEYR